MFFFFQVTYELRKLNISNEPFILWTQQLDSSGEESRPKRPRRANPGKFRERRRIRRQDWDGLLNDNGFFYLCCVFFQEVQKIIRCCRTAARQLRGRDRRNHCDLRRKYPSTVTATAVTRLIITEKCRTTRKNGRRDRHRRPTSVDRTTRTPDTHLPDICIRATSATVHSTWISRIKSSCGLMPIATAKTPCHLRRTWLKPSNMYYLISDFRPRCLPLPVAMRTATLVF